MYIRETEKKTAIAPRSLWANEEYDFSPFVIEHIDEISELLNMELEVIQSEAKVGSFELDILCKDINSDKYVIIENQIEKSDHDHLGKCLTYMSNLNAFTCVWINKEFRDEHKRALEFLNEMSSDDYNFYGINIKCYEYADGEKTYDWDLLVKPGINAKMCNNIKHQETNSTHYRQYAYDIWENLLNILPDNIATNCNNNGRRYMGVSKNIDRKRCNSLCVGLNGVNNESFTLEVAADREKQEITENELYNTVVNCTNNKNWKFYPNGKVNKNKFAAKIIINNDDKALEKIKNLIVILYDEFKKK